jgi:ferrous iron transport protein A
MSSSSILNLKTSQQRAIVLALHGEAELVSRLQELGVRIGSEVSVVGRAPFNGPILVRLGTTVVALREEEALCLQIKINPEVLS